MRPGQNRRMRGRSRNKGPNPLTRSYESNGPDVKVRGTAQHVADKYAQLARDAQVSGDPVAAENYFQHAEHYYRLIATAQEALRQQYGGTRPFDEDGEEGEEDAGLANGYGYPGERVQGNGAGEDGEFGVPQQQQPYDVPRGGNPDREQRYERGDRNERQDRGGERNQRFDRGGERFDRNSQPRPDNRYDNRANGGGQNRNERFDRNDQRPRYPRNDQPRPDYGRDNGRGDAPRQEPQRPDYPRDEAPRNEAPRREYGRDQRQDEAQEAPVAAALPAFLTNPVRTPIAFGEEPEAGSPAATNGAAPEDFASERPRRRTRARRPAGEPGPSAELAGEDTSND